MIVRHLPIERLSPEDGGHYWVGYYDKQPWLGDRVLTHRAVFCDRFPNAGEACEVGFLENGAFARVAQTRAWNWQQGAHLRWDVSGESPCLLFNDLDDGGGLISRWIGLDGSERRRIEQPLYSVTPNGRTGLSLCFGRLSRLRPEYGYPAAQDSNAADPAPSDDGIWRVDLKTGERTMLCSIRQCALVDPGTTDLTGAGAPHQHVNHIMVNPSGTRCCFLHRYDRPDGILQSRLFSIGLDGSDLRLLMEGMVSHYDWADDAHILAWGGARKLLGGGGSASPKARLMTLARRTLKPVYYAMGKPRFLMNKIVGDSYLMIPDTPDSSSERAVFAKGELTCDGHNTFFRGSPGSPVEPNRWMITDGYPDLKSRQPLFLWDLRQDRGTEIGRYHTPRELDGSVRVDLHPRFSTDGARICLDSAMDGTRAVYQVDISPVVSG